MAGKRGGGVQVVIIKDYLSYYEHSYLFFYLKKFDYSVKKQIDIKKASYNRFRSISMNLARKTNHRFF